MPQWGLVVSFIFLAVGAARAETYNLTRVDDGKQFVCTESGSGVADPNCVSDLSKYCNAKTGHTSDDCFAMASQACRSGIANLSQCVTTTSDYCDANTNHTPDDCFDLSIKSCTGRSAATIKLMQGAIQKANKTSR